ncbi:hypothetical protein ABH942_003358, partial [Flavobacterium sp. 28YEA47A]
RAPAAIDRLLVQGTLQGEQCEQGVQGSLLVKKIIIIKVINKKRLPNSEAFFSFYE